MILDLVREYNEQTDIVQEDSNGKKRCYIEGIFLQADIKNRNGRIYPSHVMEQAVNNYVESKINTNTAVGELNHPNPARPDINYEFACIKIEKLEREGSNWIGRALVTNTTHGRQIEGLIGDGVRMGVSSRALAATKLENGTRIIQPGMHICTAADVVSDPSAPKAFVEGIMENSQWIMKDGLFYEQDLQNAKDLVKQTKSKDLEKVYSEIFNILIGM